MLPYRYCARDVCDGGKCKEVVQVGGSCSRVNAVCEEGTECNNTGVDAVCVKSVMIVGKGESCDGRTTKCEPGHFCDGGKCKEIVAAGRSCARVNVVCEQGTECNNTGIDSVCVKSTTTVGQGETCDGKTTKCAQGLVCSDGKCKEIVSAGRSCARMSVVCEDGSACNNTGVDAVCVWCPTPGVPCSF